MFTQLLSDIGGLWEKYGTVYLTGIANTLILAITATLIGCIIGFFCGILQTIPCGPNENIVKRVLLKLIRIIIRAYVEIFRGTPMILQAVFIYYGMPYFFGVSFKDICSRTSGRSASSLFPSTQVPIWPSPSAAAS